MLDVLQCDARRRVGLRQRARHFPGDGAALASSYRVPAPDPLPQSLAILGAGHGGLALAGLLARHGHRVALWNRSPNRVAPVAALGGIHLTLPGSAAVLTRVGVATVSMAAALAGTRLVLVAVPASGHA